MSDQTPETAMETSEPSMEDILASIRKIIADDDAPADVMSENIIAQDSLDNIGNISDLIAPQNDTLENDDRPIDPGIEHFVSDEAAGVEAQIEPELESVIISDIDPAQEITPDASLSDDVLDDFVAEIPMAADDDILELDVETLDVETLAEVSQDTSPQNALSENLLNENLLDEAADNFDLNDDLEGLIDLEIPMPEPELETPVVSDDIITRPGMVDVGSNALQAMSGLAVTSVAAVAAVKSVSPPQGLDDIDADLSALLDTDLTLDAVPSNLVPSNLVPSDTLTDLVSPNITSEIDPLSVNQADDSNLDLDLATMLDDLVETDVSEDVNAASVEDTIAQHAEMPTNLEDVQDAALESNMGLNAASELLPETETETVSDSELEALLEDMSFDAGTDNFDVNEVESGDIEASLTPENELVEDALVAEDDAAQDDVAEEDPDLLLVKSLMADLTDDDAIDDSFDEDFAQLDDDILELTTPFDEVDETSVEDSEAELASDIPDDMDDDNDAILDEILDMTLEDELQADSDFAELEAINSSDIALESIDEVSALELDNIAANSDLDGILSDVTAPEIIPQTSQNAMSLSDIAAAANADADAAGSFGFEAVIAGVGAAGLGAVGLAATAKQIDEIEPVEIHTFEEDGVDDVEQMLSRLLDSDAETEISEDEDEGFDLEIPDPENLELETLAPENNEEIIEQEATEDTESLYKSDTTEESAKMPIAAMKNTDVIMDDVTEAATSSVFAELNQVVEEKAIVAERGDRVGDLVMEALRPMLKDWLDANLKGIVERAVTKEVKRISSGK